MKFNVAAAASHNHRPLFNRNEEHRLKAANVRCLEEDRKYARTRALGNKPKLIERSMRLCGAMDQGLRKCSSSFCRDALAGQVD